MESIEDPTAEDSHDSDELGIRTKNAGVTPPPTIDKRLETARRRRDELIKQRELEALELEISILENPEPPIIPPNIPRFDSGTPASSVRGSDESYAPELQPEKLALYYGNNIREYREFVGSVENAFRLAPRKFKLDSAKIAWTV
jgi:hypothetical protein